MQSVYALLQSKSDNLIKEEKFLLFSTQKAFDLYILQLLLLVEVKKLASEHLEIRKKNFLATPEDKNPSLKFIRNKVIEAIENSEDIKDFVSKKNVELWKENREYIRVIWDIIKRSEIYQKYLTSQESSFKEDQEFILKIFEESIAPNDKLFDFYESVNLSWVDDYPLVNTWIYKSIKQLKKEEDFKLTDFEIKDDDKEFLIDLFRKVVLHHEEYTKDINDKTPNWDADRIAEIDLILIKMSITEFLYFPSIPAKVTINEYIEIAKDYSTNKSSYFINGVLDKLLKDYNKENRLKKIGRGLM